MRFIFLAHLFPVTNPGQQPTFGTPASALIFALLFTVAILFLYFLINKLPRVRKSKITTRTEPKFIKAMIVLAIGALFSAAWDAWWHVAVGRDSFWETAHVFLYSFATAGIFLALYIWFQNRSLRWKHILFTLLIIPIAGAFDNFWHTIYGSENLANPKLLPWSPPHLLLEVAALLILAQLLVVLLKYRETDDFSFFGNLCLGGISILLLALSMPFHPTEAWGQIAGFMGAGVLAFVFVGSVIASQKIMRGRIDATLTTMFMLMIFLTAYGKEIAPQIIIMPHDRPPAWLFIFSYLATAVFLDLTRDYFSIWIRGLLAGIFWSVILFGFSTNFFLPEFQYDSVHILTAIVFSAFGGLLAGNTFYLLDFLLDKNILKIS